MIKTRGEKLININLSRADIEILIESLEKTSPRIKNKTIRRDNYELLYLLEQKVFPSIWTRESHKDYFKNLVKESK